MGGTNSRTEHRHDTLGYHDLGRAQGRPIVFLHGANQTAVSWADVADLLPDHRAICIDLPGMGLSKGHAFFSFDQAADAVAYTIEAVCKRAAVPIVGVSLGAYVGVKLALRHSRLIQSAVLSGFQTEPLSGAWWMIPYTALLSPLMTTFALRARMAEKHGVLKISSAWPQRDPPCSSWTLVKQVCASVRFDMRDDLCAIEPPILALAGEQEAAPVLNSLQDLCTWAPHAQSVLVPGGHTWPAIRPDLLARIVISWIEDGQIAPELTGRIVPRKPLAAAQYV